MDRPEPPEQAPAPAGRTGNVTRLTHEGRELFLLGTAHVSQKSVDEVRGVIAELRPDAVCVELDQARFDTLTDDSRWARLDAVAILRSGRAGVFLSSLLFAAFQKRLGDRLGVRPGAEMLAGVEAARAAGAEVVLADRDIQATLMRCYRGLGTVDRLKVLTVLGMLPFAAPELDEAQVEELKNREQLGDALEAFAKQMPTLQRPLIDERDRYLMTSVTAAPGRKVVAVVGAAHVPGMTRYLGQPADLAALSVIPPPPLSSRLLDWVVPAVTAALFAAAIASPGPGALVAVATRLAVPAVLGATLLSFAVGGGALSILTTMVVTPMSLFSPLPVLGRAAGLAQAASARPGEEDCRRIRDDVLVPGAARRNPFLRVLLVAVAAPLGRTLGALAGAVWAALALRG